MKIKIIEHIQSREGDRLIVGIPAELSKMLVLAPEGSELELAIIIKKPRKYRAA